MNKRDRLLQQCMVRDDYRTAVEIALVRFSNRKSFPNQTPVDFATVLKVELADLNLQVTRTKRTKRVSPAPINPLEYDQ